MDSPRPLFVTGLARSGTTLLARLLRASDEVELALDPFLPLFRSLRDALLRDADIDTVPPGAPLQDHYFDPARLRAFDALQAGSAAVALDPAEWDRLLPSLETRALQEAPELTPLLAGLRGETYEEVIANALRAIGSTHGRSAYVGWKEVWIVDFLPALARAFPDLRLVVIVRDPRAVLASLAAMAESDPTQTAHPLSYARHWRKQVACCERYRADPELAPLLHLVSYEQLVSEPEPTLRTLCDFLGIAFDRAMLDPRWSGNSSFRERLEKIDATPVGQWRGRLEPAQVRLAELVCGPEMALVGYEPTTAGSVDGVLEHLVASDSWPVSWRTDLGDPERDYKRELGRLELLEGRHEPIEIRCAFLFEEVHRAIRHTLEQRRAWAPTSSR